MPFWKFGHKDINVKSISFSWRIDSLGLISFICTSTINIKAMLYSLKKKPRTDQTCHLYYIKSKS